MKKRIYIKEWLEIKPYDKQVSTDSFYLSLANEINKILEDEIAFITLFDRFGDEIRLLSCFLSSYFEDIISGTNIWTAFINVHSKQYDKNLPFFDTSEYYKGEVNSQDISFLIWYFINTIQEKYLIDPNSDFIESVSKKITFLLDKEFETAPENETLKLIYTMDPKETDYYTARKFIDLILFHTYLFYTDTALKLLMQEHKILEENQDENVNMYLSDNRDNFMHQKHTRLMSLKGNEWAAEILGADHPIAKDLQNMSKKIIGYFLYKGQDDNDILIEHIASGKKFKLTKKSFDHEPSLNKIDNILFMGIVNWQNEWWFSGVHFKADYDSGLILKEKNSLKSRMAVNFLDHQLKSVSEMLDKHLKAFLKYNNGSQLAFVSSAEVESFYKGYFDFFNNSLNLSNEEIEKANQRITDEGFLDFDGKKADSIEFAESNLIFFNPKSGVEIAFEVNNAFPLPNNPFCNIENSEEDIMHLFMSEEISTELAMYCINNCKNDVPFFKSEAGIKFLKDIDFFLRFWKVDNYHSKPSITLTGNSSV